jgi:hypothetical protein
MAEVDLSEVVPPEVSEAFRDELTQRAQRRAARARSEETRARQEAARDRAALAATMGPSAAELQVRYGKPRGSHVIVDVSDYDCFSSKELFVCSDTFQS